MTNYDGKAENDQLQPLKIQEGMKIQWPFQFKRKFERMDQWMDQFCVLRVQYMCCTAHVLYVQCMYCMYRACTVCTVHVLYVQYMYCIYSTQN